MIKSIYLKAAKSIGLGCFLFISLCSFCQEEQSLQIKLVDIDTGLAIENALIINNSNTQYRFTDLLGECFVPVSYPVEIEIQHVNYSKRLAFESAPSTLQLIRLEPLTNMMKVARVQPSSNADFGLSFQAPVSNVVVTAAELKSGDLSSLQNSFNTVPGVSYESRGNGGSRRLNIRGSFIRSPFAVRNIKMYSDGIPLTNPDGSSPLELIDPIQVGNIQIMKGPAGSLFGTGNSGAVLVSSRLIPDGVAIESSLTGGKYGYFRSASRVSIGRDRAKLAVSFVNQSLDGYRDQESNSKNQIDLKSNIKVTDKLNYQLFYTHYEGEWDLPGAINQDTWDENPRTAVQYSIDNDAHVERIWDRIGVSQKFTSRKWSNTTGLYFSSTSKLNPFGTSPFFNGYKDEEASTIGGRTTFNLELVNQEKIRLNALAGGEFNTDVNELTQFSNDGGSPGEFQYTTESNSSEAIGFVKLEALLAGTRIELGTSYTVTQYDNEGQYLENDTLRGFNSRSSFENLLPRIAISRTFFNKVSVYASRSEGMSPPSIFELRNVETGVFSELREENSISYDLGIKVALARDLFVDVSYYDQKTTNAIIPDQNELGQDFFLNQGNIKQTGLEGYIQYSKIFDSTAEKAPFVRSFHSQIGFSSNDATYDNVIWDGNDLQNSKVAGIAEYNFNSSLSMVFKGGVSFDIRHFWKDKTPLNNTNTSYSEAYNLVNVKVRKSFLSKDGRFKLDAFAGLNNALDERYTSFYQLNGFGGRFFNPASARNHFVGIEFKAFL